MPQRPRVVSVEAVDLVVEGGERLLLYGLHGYLVRAAAQLREGRPALAAFLQHRPVLEMPDVGHRLLRHALDLALLLARAVGLDREDAVREPQPQLLGRHVAAAPDGDVAGRSRDGLARRLLLRYVDRRGGRAVDLEARVARQGRELCGGLAPVAQQALRARAAALSECARLSLDSTGWRGGAARRPSR